MESTAKGFAEYAEILVEFVFALGLIAFGLSIVQFRPPREWGKKAKIYLPLAGFGLILVGAVVLCFVLPA